VSGATDCTPSCGAGSVCVGSGSQGGAVVQPDGGICPQGRHLEGTLCEQNLSYKCMTIPTACSGTLSCACAGTTLCGVSTCNVLGAVEITCVEEVP
jgi:hypothetical protein